MGKGPDHGVGVDPETVKKEGGLGKDAQKKGGIILTSILPQSCFSSFSFFVACPQEQAPCLRLSRRLDDTFLLPTPHLTPVFGGALSLVDFWELCWQNRTPCYTSSLALINIFLPQVNLCSASTLEPLFGHPWFTALGGS